MQRVRGALLTVYSWLTGYRFNEHLGKTLSLPLYYRELDNDKIRGKAATSLNAAGVFLAFGIAVLAVLMDSHEYGQTIIHSWQGGRYARLDCIAVVILLYLVIRQERILSRRGNKALRYIILIFLLALSVFVFLLGPYSFQCGGAIIGPFVSRTALEPALPLAGFLSIIVSAFFQVFAIEFYDSASGWRGGDEEGGRALRFHLAGIASHSFLFGVSFALLGASLLLSHIHFWIGSLTTLATLFVLVAMTEIERELWTRKGNGSQSKPC